MAGQIALAGRSRMADTGLMLARIRRLFDGAGDQFVRRQTPRMSTNANSKMVPAVDTTDPTAGAPALLTRRVRTSIGATAACATTAAMPSSAATPGIISHASSPSGKINCPTRPTQRTTNAAQYER